VRNKPLTTGTIAGFCHVTYRCVLKWIEEDKLKAYVTPGGHHRVTVVDFLNFLKKYEMPVPCKLRGLRDKKKILIVDDDKNMVCSIRRVLKIEGRYEIDTAFDGFDAGRKILKFRPDLVLLDIRMPGMDGCETARRIKQMPEGKDVKIIAMSAYFKEDERKDILSIGVDACIDKPFEEEELMDKIKRFLAL